jgi:tRNA G10  N-methylase Trm11
MSLELNIKRMAKQELGRSVRFIPNKDKALNSAQVIHNNLLDKNGLELIIVGEKTRAIVAKTIKIQNIADYSERDYGRPKRDPRVGMLPPKLAQIMVNLTAGNDNEVDKDNPPMILDPFCGTGVVLQEALLMGYKAYGTDIDERMVNYSRTNINEWLSNRIRRPFSAPATIEIGDATIYKWHQPFELVVSETYLGRALVSLPPEDKLIDIQRTCNTIIEKFLINLSKQVPSGFLACLALPAWRKPNGSLLRLPLIDRINDLGYNSVSFEYANNAPLIYSRETQIVAREILLLKRK